MKASLCAFGEDETLPLEVQKVMLEAGLNFNKPETPDAITPEDDLDEIFKKLILPSDVIVTVLDNDFVVSGFGDRFLRTLSATSVFNEVKKLIILKTESVSAPYGLDRLPTVQLFEGEEWRDQLKNVIHMSTNSKNKTALH